jgi:RNA polymerase sigma-70 factor (ECF subfamily)
VGPWLPSPVDDDALAAVEELRDEKPSPEQRYSVRESATFAFLLAVEQLTPLRRAVLILRDVFDYSGEETAAALGISVDAVKQNLSRARKSLAEYDAGRDAPEVRAQRNEKALSALFFALARGDTDAVEDLLADDVQGHSDGGGVYSAARVIMRGPEKVARVYLNLTRLMARFGRTGVVMRTCNGNTVADLRIDVNEPRTGAATVAPPRTLISVDTDHRGKITRVYSVMAPAKLSAV